MERYLVLTKLFNVSNRLRTDRLQHKKELEMTQVSPEEKTLLQEIDAISGSGRNLLCVLKNTQNTNQRTLAKQMDISAQAVSETVKKLLQMGYITKVEGVINNENLITLTLRGAQIANRLDQRIKEHADSVLKSLSEDEMQQLDQILSKILET